MLQCVEESDRSFRDAYSLSRNRPDDGSKQL